MVKTCLPLLALTGFRSPSSKDIFIIVLGSLDSGQTSFIDLCCGSNRRQSRSKSDTTIPGPEIDKGLATRSIEHAVFEHYPKFDQGRKVHLIDTPIFDGSFMRSQLVMYQIAFLLAAAYKVGITINGLVYTQDFTQEFGKNTRNDLNMLSTVVGVDHFSRVVFATSSSSPLVNDGPAARTKFLSDFWSPVMGKRTKVYGTFGSRSDALEVVSWFASQPQPSNPLKIQDELINEAKVVNETSLGQLLAHLWTPVETVTELQAVSIEQSPFRERLDDLFDGNDFCLDPLYADNHPEKSGTKQWISQSSKRQTDQMRVYFSEMLQIKSRKTKEGM